MPVVVIMVALFFTFGGGRYLATTRTACAGTRGDARGRAAKLAAVVSKSLYTLGILAQFPHEPVRSDTERLAVKDGGQHILSIRQGPPMPVSEFSSPLKRGNTRFR